MTSRAQIGGHALVAVKFDAPTGDALARLDPNHQAARR
jgi:hypothetical protein